MKLSEAAIGQRVVMVDNTFGDEVRWTHYARREGAARFTINPAKPTPFVPAYLLRTVQGVPGEKPRYDSGEVRVEIEVDGRIPVIPAEDVNHDAWRQKPEAEDIPAEGWVVLPDSPLLDRAEVFLGEDAEQKARARLEISGKGARLYRLVPAA